MSGFNESNTKTFTAAEAMVAGRFVTFNTTADQVAYTAAGQVPIGVTLRDAASGDPVPVRFLNSGGTFEVAVDATGVAVGDRLYAAASGKASETTVGQVVGIALETSTADGDIIEVLCTARQLDTKQVTHATADATLTKQASGAVYTNLGAAGTVTLTLPQDAPKGCYFHFAIMTAQALRIDAGAAGAIYIGGAKSSDDVYIWADDEGESVMLVADGNGDWVSLHTIGTWSVV